MSTLNYLVKGTKNYTNILIRFKNGRKFDYTASTELKIEPKHWSKPKQKVKNISGDTSKDEINNHLFDLKKFIIDEFNKDNSTGEYIDREWLKKKISKYFNRPTNESLLDEVYFESYVESFIKSAPLRIVKGKNRPVSKNTIKKYNTTHNKIKDYEKRFKIKVKFTDLNLTFYEKFVQFLNKEQSINLGSIGNYIGTIKTIARDAKLKGLPVHEHINHPNFFAPSVKVDSIYLNDDEINTIYNHDFSDNEKLENARDLFIIGLRTGLRISDFLKLKTVNIKDGFFEVETQKTEQDVLIPMHSQIKEILKKRDGFPRSISDQKFNLYIKDVCSDAGLKEMIEGSKMNSKTNRKEKGVYPKYQLVSSHICRRSFASNLYGKLSNMTIMAITGHTTEAQFLKYIKITPKEHAEKLKEYWIEQEALNVAKEKEEKEKKS